MFMGIDMTTWSVVWHYASLAKVWGDEGSIEIVTDEERESWHKATVHPIAFAQNHQSPDDGMNR